MAEETYVLSRATMQALDALLRDRRGRPTEQRPARGGSWGRMPVVVRCTSATAASGSGIGAQCYPAVMIGCHATETTQPEQTAVWLTVLGDGAAAESPTADALYYGMFAGDFNPGSDNRPRVFAVASAAGSISSSDSAFSGSYAISAAGAWEATGIAITLPSAGTYWLTGSVPAVAKASAVDALFGQGISIRLHDGTNALPGSQVGAVCCQVVNVLAFGSATTSVRYVASGSVDIEVQAIKSAGGTWTTATVGSATTAGTHLGYLKLS